MAVKPELMALDVSQNAYLPIIGEASEFAGWRMLPYDDEQAAVEDIEACRPLAVVAVLPLEAYFYQSFPGKTLLDLAASISLPYAIIANEIGEESRFGINSPNMFIPKKPGLASILSWWLGELVINNE